MGAVPPTSFTERKLNMRAHACLHYSACMRRTRRLHSSHVRAASVHTPYELSGCSSCVRVLTEPLVPAMTQWQTRCSLLGVERTSLRERDADACLWP